MKANIKIQKLGFSNLEAVAETYINGNISDFKKCAALMTVPEAIDFAMILKEQYNYDLTNALTCIKAYGFGIPTNN